MQPADRTPASAPTAPFAHRVRLGLAHTSSLIACDVVALLLAFAGVVMLRVDGHAAGIVCLVLAVAAAVAHGVGVDGRVTRHATRRLLGAVMLACLMIGGLLGHAVMGFSESAVAGVTSSLPHHPS